MIVLGDGHWDGDVSQFCGRLEITADTQAEAELLASLFRLLRTDRGPARVDRLEKVASAAETIIADELAPADRVLGGRHC
jgi:hypothetical protein